MAKASEKPPHENAAQQKDDEELKEDQTFEDLGLDPRLIRALTKKSIHVPTPIQRVAIPLILVSFEFATLLFTCLQKERN